MKINLSQKFTFKIHNTERLRKLASICNVRAMYVCIDKKYS